MAETSITFKVPFFDVDPMHVVWHGNYLKYFEMARQAYAEACGMDFYRYQMDKGYVFPIIKSTVKYIHPLRFGDEFTVKVTLIEARVKVVMDFEIRLIHSNKLCTRGRTEQVAICLPNMEMELAIPEDVQKALWSLDTLHPA